MIFDNRLKNRLKITIFTQPHACFGSLVFYLMYYDRRHVRSLLDSSKNQAIFKILPNSCQNFQTFLKAVNFAGKTVEISFHSNWTQKEGLYYLKNDRWQLLHVYGTPCILISNLKMVTFSKWQTFVESLSFKVHYYWDITF